MTTVMAKKKKNFTCGKVLGFVDPSNHPDFLPIQTLLRFNYITWLDLTSSWPTRVIVTRATRGLYHLNVNKCALGVFWNDWYCCFSWEDSLKCLNLSMFCMLSRLTSLFQSLWKLWNLLACLMFRGSHIIVSQNCCLWTPTNKWTALWWTHICFLCLFFCYILYVHETPCFSIIWNRTHKIYTVVYQC